MLLTKFNRLKRQQPSKRKYWCGCDREQIGDSGKCRHCGAVEKGVKLKKGGPIPTRPGAE
jgi:hypothetical protein